MRKEIFLVEAEFVLKRLDTVISMNIEAVSRSHAKKLIENGSVFVDGRVVNKSSFIAKENSLVEVLVEDEETVDIVPEDIPLDIIYSDADFAIINKPQGMVVHPSVGWSHGTLVNAIMYHIKDLSSINGIIRPGIVHRLDKDTSGLIIIAKNNFAHNSIAKQIAEKSCFRIYNAIVDGVVKEDFGQIDAPIGRSKTDRKKMAIVKDGRNALTYYRTLERFKNNSYMEFKLSTGRTHQIRVHTKHIHHPVTGDLVYGGSDSFKLNGQLLHAVKLELTHPSTGERMIFEAPLPEDFCKILNRLRRF